MLADVDAFLLAECNTDRVAEMEQHLLKMPQVEMEVDDLYINGMYARKLTIPADTVLTGRVHKQDYINVMVSGDIAVTVGGEVKRLNAFELIPGQAGQKRVGYTFAETVWLTIDPADKEVEDMVNHISCFNVADYNEDKKLLGVDMKVLGGDQ